MNNDIQTQLEDYFTNHLPSGMEYCSVDSWELVKEGKDSSIYEVELDYKTSENEHEYRTEKVKISKDGNVSVNEGLEAKDRPHQWYIVRREIDPRSKTNTTDYLSYPPLETVEGQTDWMTKSEVEKWAKKKYGYGKAVSKNRAGKAIFINDPYNESLQRKNMNTKINIRESLNRYDLRTDNKYDLRNLYDSCNMNDKEKRAIAEMIYKNARANALYEALMSKFEGRPLVEAWVPAQYGFSQKKIPVHEFIELLEDRTQGKIEGDKNCRYIAVVMDSSVSHHGYEGVLFTDSLDEAKRFADEENHSKLADGSWEYSLPYRVFTVVYDTIDIYPKVIYPNVELNGSGFPNKKEDYKKYTYRFYKLTSEESKELVDKYAKGELKTDDEILEWFKNHGVSGRIAEENLYDLKKIFRNESTNESFKESKANPYQNISEKDIRNLEKELKKAKDPKRKSFLQATINKYKKEVKESLKEGGYIDYSETGNPSWHDDYDYDEDSGYSPDLPEKYTLVGVDGNAYAIMGYTANALKREGLRNLVDQMYKEATSDDYDNLLVVCMKYVDMANEAAYNKDESLSESEDEDHCPFTNESQESLKESVEDYDELFAEFLDITEFSLQKGKDEDGEDCYYLIDQLGANLGGIESDEFYSAMEIADRMDTYIRDYFLNDEEYGEYTSLDDLLDNGPKDIPGRPVVDMLANHIDEVDIDRVYDKYFSTKNESLKEDFNEEDFHIEKGHTIDEYMKLYGDQYEDGNLWDFLISEVEDGSVDLDKDTVYWQIGDRYYETGEGSLKEAASKNVPYGFIVDTEDFWNERDPYGGQMNGDYFFKDGTPSVHKIFSNICPEEIIVYAYKDGIEVDIQTLEETSDGYYLGYSYKKDCEGMTKAQILREANRVYNFLTSEVSIDDRSDWLERQGYSLMTDWSVEGPFNESLNEAADREVDRKGFVSLIKYGVFDPGGNYAVLRDGNFVYKFWADDDEEAKEMFRNNLKESLYESDLEKDFWQEFEEATEEFLQGKISEDTFGNKYEELAGKYLSQGGDKAKALAWQLAGANSADTYLNMEDPTAEDFDKCMEAAWSEAKILDKYGFSKYAEMVRRDMKEAEEEAVKIGNL